ncbi:hypothetical protein [Nostoc sp. ChiQUE01b]|uniref:hypothetical protein n=1 Tax=Nostoc sp. ChiQUE01b TaxID=3075376 RepID=UPI002AD4DE46|nr:hypothetical protein [Nostoc sp. ChiQUE01b]MDZ8257803.1 hypothetical protein [Nostoc sp. ChiQUE01b]
MCWRVKQESEFATFPYSRWIGNACGGKLRLWKASSERSLLASTVGEKKAIALCM